jgi:hypothetical protein
MLSIRVSGTNKATLLRVYGGLPQDVAGGDGDAPKGPHAHDIRLSETYRMSLS